MNRSVPIIGWSTLLLSCIVILLEFVSFFESSLVNQMSSLLGTFPQARSAIESMEDLFLYNRIWSIYTIIYFTAVLTGALKFVNYRETGRKILEVTCWIGLANSFAASLLSYLLWKNLELAFSSVLRSMGTGAGYMKSFGLITIIIGFFIWIIPSIGMLLYIRSQKLKTLMK